jgi:hypothetical protein
MTVEALSHSDTIGQSREWLHENREEGVSCPSCEQYVKVYRRKISSSIAEVLIAMYSESQRSGEDFIHVPSLKAKNSREVSKLVWWGFVEEQKALREDGGRAGYWRVTEAGEKWLKNITTAPKYAVTYNNTLLEMTEDEQVSIIDALGTKFNYNDLMSGV